MEEDIKKMREMAEKVDIGENYLEEPFNRLAWDFVNMCRELRRTATEFYVELDGGGKIGYATYPQLVALNKASSVREVENFRMNMMKNSDGAEYGVSLYGIEAISKTGVGVHFVNPKICVPLNKRQISMYKKVMRWHGLPEFVEIRGGKYENLRIHRLNDGSRVTDSGWIAFLFKPEELEKWYLKGKLAYAYDDYFDTRYCFELLRYIAEWVEKSGSAYLGETKPSKRCRDYIKMHGYAVRKTKKGYMAYR